MSPKGHWESRDPEWRAGPLPWSGAARMGANGAVFALPLPEKVMEDSKHQVPLGLGVEP